jgi:hypothetical protein
MRVFQQGNLPIGFTAYRLGLSPFITIKVIFFYDVNRLI